MYIGNDVVYERNADVVADTETNVAETTYASVAGRRMLKRTGGAIQYMITDHLGSTRVILAANSSVAQRFDYKPFGGDLASTMEHGEKYTGKTQDAIGLYYYGARFYDPELGRFITQDPAWDGLNWYVFCMNDPINRVDNNGKWDMKLHQAWTEKYAANAGFSPAHAQMLGQGSLDADKGRNAAIPIYGAVKLIL